MIQPWSLSRSKTEVETKILTLKTKTLVSPVTNREHDFYVLEAGGWVNIIPLTPENDVLLVRQFRQGSREITLEIPGGLIEEGQTPEETAARELLEETGFAAPKLTYLGRVRPNPAILNNWCYTYLARDAVQVGEMEPDETEDLELVRVSLDRIPEMFAQGKINHSLVWAAFVHFYLHERKNRTGPIPRGA